MNNPTAVQKRRPAIASRAWYATLILIPLLTAAGLLWLRQLQVHTHESRTISRYGSVPPFQLTNQRSEPFGSEQLTGKIWIADFVFTSCPGPCPMISSRMSELQKPLEETDVDLVTFTVDPETDTPEVLRAYAERLHARDSRWDFLTGDKTAIYNLTREGFKLAIAEGGGDEANCCTALVPCWWTGVEPSAATTISRRLTV